MTAQEWEPGGSAAKEIEEVWRWTHGLLGIKATPESAEATP
jgi:hypothetical protein